MNNILKWLNSDEGATAIEYSFIAGGISIAILAAVFLLGDELGALFNAMSDSMASAAGKV